MKVDWQHHRLAIPYKGKSVLLQGISEMDSSTESELLVQVFSISDSELQTKPELTPTITALLNEFLELITPPNLLPPQRQCDHEIPLLEGARPVTVRPYRYPPALKDEIEA